MCEEIFHNHHNTPSGGHSRYLKTYHSIKNVFWWTRMKGMIKQWVRNCDICQKNKEESIAPPGLLEPLPILDQVWIDILMDFIKSLPKSAGKSIIWTIIDRLSKFAHVILLKHPYTADQLVKIFCKEIVKLYRLPYSISSGRVVIFTSNFWDELFKLQESRLQLSSAYHLQTNRQSERVIQCLETYLRYFSSTKPLEWSKWLVWASLV